MKFSEYEFRMSTSLPPHQRYVPKLFPGSSHAWALTRMAHWRPDERILDIGIGSGIMGMELKNRGFGQISGVEIDSEARARAQELGCYTTVVGGLEELGAARPEYGHALLLDVLEHVAAPEQLLHQVCERLCIGGSVLISVPNVTHWALRLMLLAGYFRYAERGPLDKTHLRFFSKVVLQDVIASERSLELGEIVGSVVPLELMLPAWAACGMVFERFSSLRIMLAREFPSLCGYQLLVEAKKVR